MLDGDRFGPSLEDAIQRVRERNDLVRAFVWTRLRDAALDGERRGGMPAASRLSGVPYSLKDLWDTAAIPTTGGSHRYRGRVPSVSSPVYAAFEEAGAILIGKTNTPDLGLGIESQSYVGGITANPIDLTRTAGGSSGGAAAAVADRMSAFDWGSDFGGSIRIPSAHCGVYGLRLSSEAWPVRGQFPEPPLSLSYMNGQGPITARLDVMRETLRVAAPRLRTGRTRRFAPRGALLYEPGPLGAWPSFSSDVRPRLVRAIGEVRSDHKLPPQERAVNIAYAMYASHLEDFLDQDDVSFVEGLFWAASAIALRGRFGDRRFHPLTAEVLLLILLGRATVFRDRVRAERDAVTYRTDVASLWDRGYVIVSPTTTHPAPRHGRSIRNRELPMCCLPGNVADATALAVPFGSFPDGLPRSIQIWGPPGSEEVLIDIAERLEG